MKSEDIYFSSKHNFLRHAAFIPPRNFEISPFSEGFNFLSNFVFPLSDDIARWYDGKIVEENLSYLRDSSSKSGNPCIHDDPYHAMPSPQDIYCKYCCIIFENLCMRMFDYVCRVYENLYPLYYCCCTIILGHYFCCCSHLLVRSVSLTLLLLCCVHVPIVCSLTLPRCVIKYIYIFFLFFSPGKNGYYSTLKRNMVEHGV